MITTDPAAVVTRYIYAVRDGDSGAMRDSFAEDAVWEYPGDLPLSGTWRGRDTIVDDFLGSVGTALEPGSTVALEITSVLTAGDQVVAEWTSRATARGGAAYHNRNVGIFTRRAHCRLGHHDHEGSGTASSTRSFAIIEIPSETPRLP